MLSFAEVMILKLSSCPRLLGPLFVSLLASHAPAQDLLHEVQGSAALDVLGFSADAAGDVNQDGVTDFIVGATGMDVGGSESGSALVYSGADGSLLHRFDGTSPEDWLGHAVAGAGDVDQDGYDDVIVGIHLADNNGTNSGAAVVYSGQTGGVLFLFDGDLPGQGFGYAVEGVGDVDGNGVPDLMVGSPFGSNGAVTGGMARVFSGADGSVLHDLFGTSDGDRFGAALGAAGDVNQDGYADFVVGAPAADGSAFGAGLALVYSGFDGSLLHTLLGAADGDSFGFAVGGVGDLDEDGYGDVIVGAYRSDAGASDAGQVQVYSGVDGSLLWNLIGGLPDMGLGGAVDGAGDFNGDGTLDLLVGSFRDDLGGTNAGSARVYCGASGRVLFEFPGNRSGSYFGWTVAGLGDIDGDGFADILASGPYQDTTVTWAGAARVFRGSDLFQTADPASIGLNDTLTLATRGGIPGNLTMLVVTAVDGLPLFRPIPGVGFFNGAGQRVLAAPLSTQPTGTPFNVSITALAVGPRGNTIDSYPATFEIR